ncbi:MAG: trypsin-like serine protease [Spirochaetes bacterium]|nr:MAG: trypsin-like serine protease [Spirochaetota bacterium]
MRNKRYYMVPVAALFVVSLFLYPFSCAKKASTLFGESSPSPLKGKSDNARAWDIQNAFREIYDLYKDRVVFISTEQTVKLPTHPFFSDPMFREFFGVPEPQQRFQKRTGLGSGFILSEDGYICTNHHVIAAVDKVTVKVGEKVYPAAIIGSDERTDIALLKISPGEPLKPVYLGNSDEVRVGDWAIAIGNPFGLDKTFTVGVISAASRRDVDMAGGSESHIQTDATINPGNSGGPLINIDGEVVGINRMIYSNSGGSIGIGFAIPINTAKAIFEQLKNFRKVVRGYIGVQVLPITREIAQELGLATTDGALVRALVEGGPAAQGGVQANDIITAINDTPVKGYGDLIDIVGKTPVGTALKLTVLRAGAAMNLYVTVAQRP